MFRLIFWLAVISALCFFSLKLPILFWFCVWLAAITLFLGGVAHSRRAPPKM